MNTSYAVAAVRAAGVAAGLALLLGRVLKAAHKRPLVAGDRPRSPAVGAQEGNDGRSGVEDRVLRLLTRTIRALLSLGVRMGPMMMLTVPGRKTGLPSANPVDLFEQDGQHWLVSTHQANSSSVLNLRA